MTNQHETTCNGMGEEPGREGEPIYSGGEYMPDIVEDYFLMIKEEQTKMGTIREEALAYEPQLTLNVADLDSIPINLDIQPREGKNKEGEVFHYKVVVIEGKEYRITSSVLEEIQTILKLKPTVTKVNVTKSGSGLATRYKVEALD